MNVLFAAGDSPYKGFTPGELVTDYFDWPDGHDQVGEALLALGAQLCLHSMVCDGCDYRDLWQTSSSPTLSASQSTYRKKTNS